MLTPHPSRLKVWDKEMWRRIPLIVTIFLMIVMSVIEKGEGSQRMKFNVEDRNIVYRTENGDPEAVFDSITLNNYLRGYLRGPVNGDVAFFNHDVISAYVGPAPLGHLILKGDKKMGNGQNNQSVGSSQNNGPSTIKNTIRAWAMFDENAEFACDLNQIHNWGESALFTCPKPGIYRAYAHEYDLTADRVGNISDPSVTESNVIGKPTLSFTNKQQKEIFDLLLNPHYKEVPLLASDSNDKEAAESVGITFKKRMEIIRGNIGNVVKSDPVLVKSSYFCYYWMFTMKEIAKVGYLGNEIIPPKNRNDTAYRLMEVRIWVAEPSAVSLSEHEARIGPLVISEYSRVITNRFYDTGLFPCLRKAHQVIEIVSEIVYVSETDQANPLSGAPHWKAVLKVYTDRLISTLSDVTFTIASRQNTGSFHCFVGDTKVYMSTRGFQFVEQKKLERGAINVDASSIWWRTKVDIRHTLKHVYGHGIQYLGAKHMKLYQPATTRHDMVIVSNPCVVQEFAMAVGGSLYIGEGFLRRGVLQATRVVLPDFSSQHGTEIDPNEFRRYLRVSDINFTPTHVVILMADGSVILHPTSVALKGIGRFKNTHKYRPTSFVKRRWCPKTATPKFSAMTIPIFSRSGSIVILQLYSVEGSVRMWVSPPSASCLTEGAGEVSLAREDDETLLVNETDIHYSDYVSVARTNQKTGLHEPPPPLREEPVPPVQVNLEAEKTFLLNNGMILTEGQDPHFPQELLDPARHLVGSSLQHYNDAVIYVLEDEKRGLKKLLNSNGLTNVAATSDKDEMGLYTVEFAAIEKQFIGAVKFTAEEIGNTFSSKNNKDVLSSNKPFQMIITTVTVTNFPFRVKLRQDHRDQDETLDTIIPFPGTILVRSKPYLVDVRQSRDLYEHKEHVDFLKGDTTVEYTPELFMLNTAIPSYIIDFGDILVYTSLESRFARPLHFYSWDKIDKRVKENYNNTEGLKSKPLVFTESTAKFNKESRLYDLLVTDQGIISVLWRKGKRHFVKEQVCEEGKSMYDRDDTDPLYLQTAAMGSVISLEGLREVQPFFRHDNVFQRATNDGEVVYGVYDTKPYSPFQLCQGNWNATANDYEGCIDQGDEEQNDNFLPYCAIGVPAPCRDPAYLDTCIYEQPNSGSSKGERKACIRKNKLICEDYPFKGQTEGKDTIEHGCISSPDDKADVTTCWPQHAPREELRSVNFLTAPFMSYLLGSLQTVKSLHPEAPVLSKNKNGTESNEKNEDDYSSEFEEPSICPFSSFNVYNVDFDFAEVGYETRITGQISYFGTGIPTEADLIVEFDPVMGVIVDVSSSVEEQRGLTTIRKTIDIKFRMTDFVLGEIQTPDAKEQNDLNLKRLDFDDIRAREKSQVFSVTIRPSIVNNHCRSSDYFKTIQFNVGCNTFSTLRLIAEAAPFSRMDWKENELTEQYKWIPSEDGTKIIIPRQQIYHKQHKGNVFVCDEDKSKSNTRCEIPYYDLYGNENKINKNNIFTVSYRDYFSPKFEQFLTVSARPMTGNVVIYDLLGSKDFQLTVNNLQAGCHHTGDFWYDKLLNTTSYINHGSSEHENIYTYFKNCFDTSEIKREQSHQLSSTKFHLHNQTNGNRIKFERKRNQIFIFRAVVINTEYNRFTYCKTLETYFMVRVVGIPIPRQGLELWSYLLIVFIVVFSLILSYLIFFHFCTWKLDTASGIGGLEVDDPGASENREDEE